MKHYQMIEGACAYKSFFPKYRSLLGPGQRKLTDWSLLTDQTVPRGIGEMAGIHKE